MSPEVVKEKLTVTAAPPPAAAAFEKKGPAKKRAEAENLIDGHVDTIKGPDSLSEEARGRLLAKQGRTGGIAGVLFFGLASFWLLTHHGRYWHLDEGALAKPTLDEAYHHLRDVPWLFETSTRLMQFRIFVTLTGVFFLSALLIPRIFGVFWMKLAGVLGFINTRILLGVAFYVLFTPWAILTKIMGKDPLRRAKTDGSYWISRAQPRPSNHFERLF